MLNTKLQNARRTMKGGPSATTIAKRARISMGQFSQIERGEVRPGPRTVKRIADALGLSVPSFMALWLLDREVFLLRELDRTREEMRRLSGGAGAVAGYFREAEGRDARGAKGAR